MGGGSDGTGSHSSWTSAELNFYSSRPRSYGHLDSIEPSIVNLEKARVNDAAVISGIDCIMRRHTDDLMHSMDGLSARLLKLESRTRQLEVSVDDLKVSVGSNHCNTHGKIENILLEVKSCVQDLKYKQELMHAEMQLEEVEISKVAETQQTQNVAYLIPAQQMASVAYPQLFPASIYPCALPYPQEMVYPFIQTPSQYPPTSMPAAPQLDTYFTPISQTQEVLSPQKQPRTLPGQYQLFPPSPYLQGQQSIPDLPPQFQQAGAHIPCQTSVSLPFLQATPAPYMYDSPVGTSNSGLHSDSFYGYDVAGRYELHSSGTGSKYNPQIASAKIQPHGSGNRVPVDNVLDRVANMGFPREDVKETVRTLTENGQAVELNVVLDKLMNAAEVQSPRAWFGP